MALDPRLWQALEQCGVRDEHLRALLRFFQAQQGQQAGSFTWHGRLGHLERCVLELHFSGRPYSVQQVSETVLATD